MDDRQLVFAENRLLRLTGPRRRTPSLVQTLNAVLTAPIRWLGPAATAPSGGRQPQKLSESLIPSKPIPGLSAVPLNAAAALIVRGSAARLRAARSFSWLRAISPLGCNVGRAVCGSGAILAREDASRIAGSRETP